MKQLTEHIFDYLHTARTKQRVVSRYSGIQKIKLCESEVIQRITDDITHIKDRIDQGEYYLTDFTPRRKFDVVGRMKEFYIYLESYTKVGKDRQRIFENLHLQDHHKILNIGPGWSPKIELGLYYQGFGGKVTICDLDKKSSQHIKLFMNIFNHSIGFKQKTGNFMHQFFGKYDIICANHLIDDLVVSDYLVRHQLDVTDYYDEFKTREITDNIIKQDNHHIEQLVNLLSKQLLQHLTKNGKICFNHYPSYVDDIYGNKIFYLYCKKVISKLKNKLIGSGMRAINSPQGLSQTYFPKNSYFILERTNDTSR